MASTKTVSKGIRIANEAAEYYRDKPLNRIVESLIPLIESGEVSVEGGEVKIQCSGGVHSSFEVEDIKSMCSLSGLPYEEAMKEVHRLMEEGILQLSSRGIDVEKPLWVESIEDVCHDKGIPVEKIVEIVRKI